MNVLGWILHPLGVDSADVHLSLTCSSKTILCSSQRIFSLSFTGKCEYSIEISIGNGAVGWYQYSTYYRNSGWDCIYANMVGANQDNFFPSTKLYHVLSVYQFS